VDHFSKWAEAIPIQNHTASTVARALIVHVFSRYGTPLQLLTDRGAEFESSLFQELMKWYGTDKIRTTAFKPSTNGAVERFHRTLNSMLGKVVSQSQRDWDSHLPYVMAAYRSSVHSSTGFTPNKLFLGRENRAPLDLVMGIPAEDNSGCATVDDFVANQQEMAERSYQQVREHLQTNAEWRKVAYDTRVRQKEFTVSTWVWYHYPRRYQQRSPKWQRNFTGPYLIVREIPPVNYVLQKSKHAKPFVVHCDKLRRCHGETPTSWIADDVTSPSAESARSQEQRTVQDIPVSPCLEPSVATSTPRVPRRRDTELQTLRENIPECTGRRPRRPPQHLNDFVC